MFRSRATQRQIRSAMEEHNLCSGSTVNSKLLTKLFQELVEGDDQFLSIPDAKLFVKAFFSKLRIPVDKKEVKHFVDACSTDQQFSLEKFTCLLTQTVPRGQLTESVAERGQQINGPLMANIFHVRGSEAYYVQHGFVWTCKLQDLLNCQSTIPRGAFKLKGASRIREISLSNFIAMVDYDGILWVSKDGPRNGVDKVPNFPRIRSVCATTEAILCISETGELWNHKSFFDYPSGSKIGLPARARKVTESFVLLEDGSLMAIGENKYGELGLGDNIPRSQYTQVPSSYRFTDVACGSGFSVFLKRNGNVYACGTRNNGALGMTSKIGGIQRKVSENIEDRHAASLFHNFKDTMKKVKSLSRIKQIQCNGYYTICVNTDGTAYIFGSFDAFVKDSFGNINIPRVVQHVGDVMDVITVKQCHLNIFKGKKNSVWVHKPNSCDLLPTTSFLVELLYSRNENLNQIVNHELITIRKLDKDLHLTKFLQSKGIDELTSLTTKILQDFFQFYKETKSELIEKERAQSLLLLFFMLLRVAITEEEIMNHVTEDLTFLSLCGLVKKYFPASRLASEVIFLATGTKILCADVKPRICEFSSFNNVYCVSASGALSKINMDQFNYKNPTEHGWVVPVLFSEECAVSCVSGSKNVLFILDSNNCVWQLGKFGVENHLQPQLMRDLFNIVAVACGDQHAIFVTSTQRVLVLGDNFHGQLGDSSVTSTAKPILIPGIQNALNVFCGVKSSFVLGENGAIWACGSNHNGVLAIRTSDSNITTFTLVSATSSVVSIQSSHSTAFLLSDGSVVLAGCCYNPCTSPQPNSILSGIIQIDHRTHGIVPFYFINSEGAVFKLEDNAASECKMADYPPVSNIYTSKGSYSEHEAFLDFEDNFYLRRINKTTPKVQYVFSDSSFIGYPPSGVNSVNP